MMNVIRFSHDYAKFFEDVDDVEEKRVIDEGTAYLLEVFTVEKKELSPAFIMDDTLIYEKKDTGKHEFYPLSDGLLLFLLFRTFEGFMFTTIRWWTEEKEAYYRGLRGKAFEVNIDRVLPSSADKDKRGAI